MKKKKDAVTCVFFAHEGEIVLFFVSKWSRFWYNVN